MIIVVLRTTVIKQNLNRKHSVIHVVKDAYFCLQIRIESTSKWIAFFMQKAKAGKLKKGVR